MTVFLKSNASQLTDVRVDELGFVVPSAGSSSLEFVSSLGHRRLKESAELLTKLTDDAHGVDSSTLILNDGTADVPQDAAEAYLAEVAMGVTRPNGPADLTYDVNGKLESVDYDTGDQVQLAYNGTTGLLETVTQPDGSTTSLTYTSGVLTRVS